MARRAAGSVYPRRNKAGEIIGWVADVQWGRGATAERIRRLRPDEQTARQTAQELIAARDAGVAAEVYGLTMLDLMQRYIGAKEAGAPGVKPWAPSTLANHVRTVRVHILPALKDKLLTDLGKHDLEHILKACRYDDDGDELRSVPAQVYQLVAQALKWGRDERLVLDISWLLNVPRPRYEAGTRREFTDDEFTRLRDAARERPDAAFWVLLLDRGLRVSEASALLRPNIDRTARLLRLTHGLERGDGGPRLVGRLKTKNSRRSVPLSQTHLDLLDAQLDRIPAMREKAGDAWKEYGLVFPGASGRPLDIMAVHRGWKQLLAAARITDYAPPHATRHTATSRMLRHIPLTEVAAIIGDTPTTLLRVYGHAQIETARPALERLDARG